MQPPLSSFYEHCSLYAAASFLSTNSYKKQSVRFFAFFSARWEIPVMQGLFYPYDR
jgi:hypothetical protein